MCGCGSSSGSCADAGAANAAPINVPPTAPPTTIDRSVRFIGPPLDAANRAVRVPPILAPAEPKCPECPASRKGQGFGSFKGGDGRAGEAEMYLQRPAPGQR